MQRNLTKKYFIIVLLALNPVGKHGKLKLLNIVLAIVLTVISVFILNHFLFSIKNMIDPTDPRPGGHRDEFD